MIQPVKTIVLKAGGAILLACGIVYAIAHVKHSGSGGEADAAVWFYNQNSQQLYPASRNVIPPDGNSDAKVRAIVIGFQGMGNDVSQLKIAYLEKYSAEFKALLERAEAAHAAKLPFLEKMPSQGSAYFLANTFVKRPGEATWHGDGTVEARRIKSEWREWRGPAGQPPIISVPAL